jgi:glycosyltransferase involved in cell wall biosynthesis
LIGPLAKGEGFTGEDAYVEGLLTTPPTGVEYVYYGDLLDRHQGWHDSWRRRIVHRLSDRHWDILPYFWFESFDTAHSFDLIHVHGFALHIGRTLRRQSVPVVFSMSSDHFFGLRGQLKWPEDQVQRWIKRATAVQRLLDIWDSCRRWQIAQQIIVWSESARRGHIEAGVAPERLIVIPPFVGLPLLRSVGHHHNNVVRLLFIGNDFQRKGGHDLLMAYRRLRSQYGDQINLTVIGRDGATVALGATPGLVALGSVSHAALLEHAYAEHDLFVLPTHHEGYGVTVLEAMAHGLPCVVTDVGAMPDMVVDGYNGFRITSGNVEQLVVALSRLIENPELRHQMSMVARRRVETHFSPTIVGAQIRQVYEHAIASS